MAVQEHQVKVVRLAPLTIKKETTNGEASLSWSVRMGFPRITVHTEGNTKNEDGTMNYDKIIIAPLDYVNLKYVLTLLKQVIDSEGETKYTVECYNSVFKDRVRMNEVKVQAKIILGKDQDGVIYLSAIEDNKTKIKFDLLPSSKWFKYYDKDNKEITDKSRVSKLYATGYLELLQESFINEFKTDVKREDEFTFVRPPREDELTVDKKETVSTEVENKQEISVKEDTDLDSLFN